ncbi:MAG: hypothetical protein AVDCRST_MAG85-318, partial [uncultured Solirubrobacteraceae bacterium]
RSRTQRLRTPEVATTSNGAVVAWTRNGRVETRRVSRRTGRLSLISRLSPKGRQAFGPTFVGGTVPTVLAWQLGERDPELQIGIPRSSGAFAGTLRYPFENLIDLDVTTTRGGGLLAAYTRRRAGDGQPELMVAEQRPGSPRLVEIARMREPVAPSLPVGPSVAVTDDGRTLVAWSEASPDGRGRVVVSERPRGGEFGDPVEIAAGGQPSRVSLLPKSDGTVLAAFVTTTRPSLTSPGTLRIADVRTGAVRALTRSGERVADYTVSLDGRGAAHFGWITGGRVIVRVVDGREQRGARRTLSAPGERVRQLALAAGSNDVAAVWTTARAVRASSR